MSSQPQPTSNFMEPYPVHMASDSSLPHQYIFDEAKFTQKPAIPTLGISSFSASNFQEDPDYSSKRPRKGFDRFECPEENCGKVFYDKGAFRKHQLTHGEKLFICKVCQKKFLDNSKLRRHSLVHSGEKNYKCEICDKKFSLDFNLRTHMRIHSGEKPYACVYPGCFKRFSQSSNLSAHEKTHEILKNGLVDESLGRAIFSENPLKYLIDNPYSGTETIENVKKINALYDMMQHGIAMLNPSIMNNFMQPQGIMQPQIMQNSYIINSDYNKSNINMNNYNNNNTFNNTFCNTNVSQNANIPAAQSNNSPKKVVFFQTVVDEKKDNKNTNLILDSYLEGAMDNPNNISVYGKKNVFYTVNTMKEESEMDLKDDKNPDRKKDNADNELEEDQLLEDFSKYI